ncbi:hypothetical protein [Sorangium cellulosum]|uniref:hypothetical protein n=1 Tax=Sorangium cellulosum TaxID=56 RepID=UPI001F2DBB8D|nr:hypothetical protein [Sorangium cellulosum]
MMRVMTSSFASLYDWGPRRPARWSPPWTALVAGAAGALLGCNAPAPPEDTGGTDAPEGPCGIGAVVISSDYQSTSVGLLSWDGAVLSASIASSASAPLVLSAPLSGDVTASTMPLRGGRLALVDRSASALTWLDARRGEVTGQLSVATGFTANPQDYIEVSPVKAYVPRLEPNLAPGAQPLDGGSDVLVVDPEARALVGRVDLAPAMAGEDPEFHPRPSRAALVEDSLYVLLTASTLSFLETAASRLVEIDARDDAIKAVTLLDGLHGCAGLAVSPSGARLAVVCSGSFGGDATANLAEAGVVILARGEGGLVEERRWTAAELGEGSPGFSVAFASEDTVLLTTLGHDAIGGVRPVHDTLTAADLSGGAPRVLLRSKELPFSLGEVRCAAACGRCLVADAETDGGVVHRFDVGAGGGSRALVHAGAFHVDPRVGLPPRYLGAF